MRVPESSTYRHRLLTVLAAGISVAVLAGCGTGSVTAGGEDRVSSAVRSAERAAAEAQAEAEGSDASSELADLAQKVVDAGAPGVIVRVNRGDEGVHELVRQSSWSEPDHRLTAGDEFRVGSNTKTLIAALLLQQVADGRLGLDDPVERWLPGAVPNGNAITLRMLLNHTSGLHNTQDPAVQASVFGLVEKQWTAEDLLAVGTSKPPLFEPGEGWSYSNTNYIALGMVLEKVTGETLPDLVEQRIARPLDLRHTYLAVDAAPRGSGAFAHGYEPDAANLAPLLPPGAPEGLEFAGPEHDGHVDTTGIDPGFTGASGAVVSSVRDWDRFLTALLSGEVVPPALVEQMRSTVPTDDLGPTVDGYGLGLAKMTTPCGTVWGHRGGIPGYDSQSFVDETGDRSAMVFVTTYRGLSDPELQAVHQELVMAAACTMYGRPVPGR